MKSLLAAKVLAAVIILVSAATSHATTIAIASVGDRVAMAEHVVVGKVTKIEDKAVLAPRFPGTKDEYPFQIGIVEVKESLVGAKGLTHVRVGFQVPPAVPANPNVPVVATVAPPQLKVGQEGIFFLRQHGKENFFTHWYGDFIGPTETPHFAATVVTIKKLGKLLENPQAGLKAKSADDRFLTAALLLARYTTPPVTKERKDWKQIPIPAEESRLILNALYEADWNRKTDVDGLTPVAAFFKLNLTPNDGFQRPRDYRQVPAAAKKWLKKNMATYRIQRYVK
ncbi:MAG: hypothetical protein KatS3mg105_0734 [Gemmatales bacterium]|nr:MAG: hypothetical protein KatS3mg105_0734 [Gemmatales bacterium]